MKCNYKNCNKNCEKEYCFQHKPKKPLLKGGGLKKKCMIKNTLTTKKQVNVEHIIQMQEFFKLIWNKRNHISEISNEYLGNNPLSIFFHHILPKSKYPQAQYDEDNIILLTFAEHQTVEGDIYKYPKINEIRNKLKIKYNIL